MKSTIILCLMALPFLFYGQAKSSISLVGGLEYSYRNLPAEGGIRPAALTFNDIRQTETGRLGFRAGLNYSRNIAHRFWIKSGIRYVQAAYYNSTSNYTFPTQIDPQTGEVIEQPTSYLRKYHFMEIPLMARYVFNDKKLSPFAELGIASQFCISSQITNNYALMFSNPHTVHFVVCAAFGVNYHVSSQYAFFAQANSRYHFTPLANTDIKEYLYNSGVEFGLSRYF